MQQFKWLILSLSIATAANAADVTIEISNRQSPNSSIICGLFESKQGFPTDNKKAAILVNASFENDKTSCKFSDLKATRFAIAVMEDLNGNGRLDTTFVGFPKKPWGVSNNAPAHAFSPPTFDEAAVEKPSEGEIKSLSIKLIQP